MIHIAFGSIRSFVEYADVQTNSDGDSEDWGNGWGDGDNSGNGCGDGVGNGDNYTLANGHAYGDGDGCGNGG